MMDDAGARNTGRIAVATGLVAAGSAVSLATYFAVGGPFGTINDIGNGATGVLGACLAWRLRRQIPGRLGDVAAAAALVGAALTVVGSALVISRTTGFFFAGLVSSVGFAGIGAWVVVACRRAGGAVWPRSVRTLGVAAGLLMVIGVVSAAGIPLRLDDMATAPGWVWVGSLGWLGTYVVLPAWALRLGAFEARSAGNSAIAATAAVSEPS